MPRTETQRLADLNSTLSRAVRGFRPPESLTVDEWADRYRRLSPEASAEAGPWRTSRTPYLAEPMRAFTDPRVRKVVIVAGSQIGKTECELNCLAYLMDQDPGTVLFVQPTIEDAKKFSRLRVEPMIRDCPRLRRKVRDAERGQRGAKTVLQKTFPGGMLMMTGSNVASALASTPARYIIGDERDRWAVSAGREGDPWKLAEARQTTFYNAKAIEVSTPTVRGASAIETAFAGGTQERWVTRCPECGEWHDIDFDQIRFDFECERVNGRKTYRLKGEPMWCCPSCGCLSSERAMREAPSRWRADNPAALGSTRTRSFWLNAFCSPWTSWSSICLDFLEAKDDPARLQVVYNTLFGRLWEDRGDLVSDDEMMARREDYGERPDGTPVELPDGALVVTVGVDVQDTRLEYEVVAHGRWGETWGLEKGVIAGRPDDDEVWGRLDGVTAHVWRRRDGRGVRASVTCVDSGGHYTQEVYERCRQRQPGRVFAIKGKGGEGVPYVAVPTRVAIRDKRRTCWLYTIGVDAGKSQIMNSLKVQEPGPRYCHFPRGRGYDEAYFAGLLSERLVLSKTGTGSRWRWEKIPGHERNEALDCRNYAMAALAILNPDWDALERQMSGEGGAGAPRGRHRKRTTRRRAAEDW